MFIVGVDLSGPSNTADTVLVAFKDHGGELSVQHCIFGATDSEIFQTTAELSRQSAVVVGLDAPLSYNQGGGDRPGDRALRQQIIAAGLLPGSVMTPTMTRMVYLTLRGLSLARTLQTISNCPPHIVEVHPGAAMALRGAPIDAVRSFKGDTAARQQLLEWLERQGVRGVAERQAPSDHYVAACAAALAAWKWHVHDSVWLHAAIQPLHPFDYAC